MPVFTVVTMGMEDEGCGALQETNGDLFLSALQSVTRAEMDASLLRLTGEDAELIFDRCHCGLPGQVLVQLTPLAPRLFIDHIQPCRWPAAAVGGGVMGTWAGIGLTSTLRSASSFFA